MELADDCRHWVELLLTEAVARPAGRAMRAPARRRAGRAKDRRVLLEDAPARSCEIEDGRRGLDAGTAYERCRQLYARHERTYYSGHLLRPRWKRRHVPALCGLPATPTSWSTISTALDRKREAAALAAFGERFFTVLRGGPATTRCCRWGLRTIRAFDLEVATSIGYLEDLAVIGTILAPSWSQATRADPVRPRARSPAGAGLPADQLHPGCGHGGSAAGGS
jgi:hypothetical protein